MPIEEARDHVAALAGSPGAVVTFQTFDDDKGRRDPTLAHVLRGTLNEHAAELERLNGLGAGIFITVNGTDGRGRAKENVVSVRAGFTDSDSGPTTVPYALLPSFVVASKHGPHSYWLTIPGQPLERFTEVQVTLAAFYGTDPSVKDLPRVMRLAGFHHMKDQASPFLVRISQADTGARYTFEEILAAHPVLAATPRRTSRARTSTMTLSRRVKRAEAYVRALPPAVAGQHGHDATFEAALKIAVGFDLEDDTAFEVLEPWNQACEPPWSEPDLRRKIREAQKRGCLPRGFLLTVDAAPDIGAAPADSSHVSPPGAGGAVYELHRYQEIETPEEDAGPAPLDEAAFYGLAGEFVRIVEPHTEADPKALLAQFLVAFGSAVGRGPFVRVGATRHYPAEYIGLVGQTGKGRKGTSWDEVRRPYLLIEDPWVSRITTGLSSGEGVLWAVRDPIEKQEPIREGPGKGHRGNVSGYETVIADPGSTDKRLLVIESELGRVLRVLERDGNTLSAVVRELWDCKERVSTLTKNTPAVATGAHVSIVGHITSEELTRYLDKTDVANGFGNRFMWIQVRRARELPEGGSLRDDDLRPVCRRLRLALDTARGLTEVRRDPEAAEVWRTVYSPLSAARVGLFGAITGRAEAHALRLSLLYALMDGSDTIRMEHLDAALALWTYSEDSARSIFGLCLGDPDSDAILRALREAPEGLTRTDIFDVVGRHTRGSRITAALTLLQRHKLARGRREFGPGRPVERWFACHLGGEIGGRSETSTPLSHLEPPEPDLDSSSSTVSPAVAS